MPRDVNIFTGNWTATGTRVLCPRYQFTVRVEWKTNAGVARSAERTVTFPDDLLALAQLGGADKAWIEDELRELMLRVARRLAKVDEE